jgi:hypothetical protein
MIDYLDRPLWLTPIFDVVSNRLLVTFDEGDHFSWRSGPGMAIHVARNRPSGVFNWTPYRLSVANAAPS